MSDELPIASIDEIGGSRSQFIFIFLIFLTMMGEVEIFRALRRGRRVNKTLKSENPNLSSQLL